jgi:hypothetical protein
MIRHLAFVALALIVLVITPVSQAGPITYVTALNGPNESPPNSSPATGSATVVYDPTAHTLAVNVSFSGLTTLSTAAHIHATTAAPGTGTAGVATVMPAFPGFPLNVTSGSYMGTLDLTSLSSYNPAFVTNNGGTTASAEATLAAALANDQAYLNIHTSMFPSGEIRGFLLAVPEPLSIVMLSTGVLGVLAYQWRTKKLMRK